MFETLRIKRYGRLVLLLTPAMKIISYDFNMLGYDYSVPQPVMLRELGALMQQFQHYQHSATEADMVNGLKPHEVMQTAVNALASLGHGLEREVKPAFDFGNRSFRQQLILLILYVTRGLTACHVQFIQYHAAFFAAQHTLPSMA